MKNILLIVCLLLVGCKSMTSPNDTFVVGERVKYSWYQSDIIICQVVSNNEIHAYSYDENGYIDGLRIAIIPRNGGYVTGEYVRHGVYEYIGPHTYIIVKDGKGNNEQTNTIRLFKEIDNELIESD